MKRIFIINEYISSQRNGIGRFIKELIDVLYELNISINIIELNSPCKEFVINEEKFIRKICFPPSNFFNYFKKNSFSVICLLKLYVKDSENNIFILNHSPSHALFNAIRKYYPLSKMIFVIHDLSWTNPLLGNKELFQYIMNNRDTNEIKVKYQVMLHNIYSAILLFKNADYILCLSKGTSDLITDYYKISKEKILFCPNYLKDKRKNYTNLEKKIIREQFHIRNEKIIITVGRLSEAKGTIALIRSFKFVLEKYPATRLVCIGSLSDPNTIIEECNPISSKITFTGQISSQELDKWYQIADVGIIASYTEQCSYVGIEMLMNGLPIIASDGFGVSDMFQDRFNCLVAKICDYQSSEKYEKNLSNCIIQMLSSETLRKTLSKKAKETYTKKYSSKSTFPIIQRFMINC